MNQEHQPHEWNAEVVAESQVEEARRLQQQLDDSDFQWLMSDKRGRRYVWRMLGLAGVFRNSFSCERQSTDFNCGKQLMGQTLIADIHRLCPEQYNRMVTENRKHGTKRARSS